MAAVAIVFGLLLIGGLLLHQWGQRRAEEAAATPDDRDLRDLADPSRWPSPPGSSSEEPPGDRGDSEA